MPYQARATRYQVGDAHAIPGTCHASYVPCSGTHRRWPSRHTEHSHSRRHTRVVHLFTLASLTCSHLRPQTHLFTLASSDSLVRHAVVLMALLGA